MISKSYKYNSDGFIYFIFVAIDMIADDSFWEAIHHFTILFDDI